LLPPLHEQFQIFFIARNMYVIFTNPEPSFLVADRMKTNRTDHVYRPLSRKFTVGSLHRDPFHAVTAKFLF
jgi:hypothetical protein